MTALCSRMCHAIGRTLCACLIAVALLLLAGCGPGENDTDGASDGVPDTVRAARADTPISMVYPEWSSEIATAHLLQAVLQERLGYTIEMRPVGVGEMWRQVATGEADVLAGAWLPTTHQEYYAEYGERVDDLGPNLVGARIGLVVPTAVPGRQTGDTGRTGRELVTVTSIDELAESAERFEGRIVGIEHGAGIMARTREALTAYGLGGRYRILETSEPRMLDRLAAAVQRRQWIVLTGWRPHWIFELYALRFLDDPNRVYGGEESIHTMVRRGFAEYAPEAYEVLSRASWHPEELERLMLWIHEGDGDPYVQALRWMEVNDETVDSWLVADE